MKNKKDIRFILIFIIVVTLSLMYLFRTAYAKYKREILGNTNSTIANWNIKVNNESINNKTVLTNYITPTFDANQYVKSNVLAPGSTGYFEIVINAQEVDVDFNYEIAAGVNEDTPLNDLKITSYEQNNTTSNYNDTDKITGTIQKNTGNTTIKIYFEWDDNSQTETMNNRDDTEYAIDPDNQTTKIKVTLKFTQRQS